MNPTRWQQFKRKVFEIPFFMKLFHWEFWPFNVVYFPVIIYYVFLAAKARSFFFFSAANPPIEFGGMLGESKGKVFELIPDQYIPATHLFLPAATPEEVTQWMATKGLRYPILLKPDIGERGWMVKKVNDPGDLEEYLQQVKVSFLAQAYVGFPIELGLFYYRFPGTEKGKISSITRKGLMQVTGNGEHSVRELLLKNPRARLYISDFEEKYPEKLSMVPQQGQLVEVEPIGNHCRGTTFLNDTGKVTAQLQATFDRIASQIPGFHFGRFDIRCQSYEDLEKGQNFKILELNGAGAEPGHIYHPGRSLWKGYSDILHHLNVLCNIAIQNHRLGVPYTSLKEGLRFIRKIKAYNRLKGVE